MAGPSLHQLGRDAPLRTSTHLPHPLNVSPTKPFTVVLTVIIWHTPYSTSSSDLILGVNGVEELHPRTLMERLTNKEIRLPRGLSLGMGGTGKDEQGDRCDSGIEPAHCAEAPGAYLP